MSSCIEREALAPERAAIASNHVVLLDQQHSEAGARQEVSCDQAPDPGAYDDCIIRAVRAFPQRQTLKGSFHLRALIGSISAIPFMRIDKLSAGNCCPH